MKILLTILLLSTTSLLSATTYYVSSSTGNDNNDGQSTTTAWRSVSRVNLVMDQFQPGDQILFKRDDSFIEPLEIRVDGAAGNPILFGAYGEGEKPVIGAGVSINGWSETADENIWRSGCRICPDEIANFYIDGVPQQIGRHPNIDDPNEGYLIVDSHVENTSLTDSELPDFANLVGSEVVYKPNRSLIVRTEITSHDPSGNTIGFANNNAAPTDGYGYFLQDNYETLDRNGEWFWDADRSTMYLYYAGNPNALATNATYSNQALSINYVDHITVENLSLKNAAREVAYIVNGTGITFQNNDVSGAGTRGVVMFNSEIQFLDNVVEYSNNLGLDIYNCANSNFLRNTIRNTGTIAGMGGNNYGSYTGVYMSAPNGLFKNNVIENTGYDGIYFHDDNLVIEENYIHNFLLVKTSGGGIHTYAGDNTGRSILNNIIVDGKGNAAGTTLPDNYFAYGIHLNGSCKGIEVSGNSIGHIRGEGIAMRTVQDVTMNNNTIYGSSFSQLTVTGYSSDPATAIRNLDVTNNVFFAAAADAWGAEIYSQLDDVNQFGNWNNNYYCRPLAPAGLIRRAHHPNGTWSREVFNLDRWNDAHTHDENSAIAPLTIPAFAVDNYLTDNLFSNGDFAENTDNWSVWGPEGNYEQQHVTNQLDNGCLEHEFTATTPAGNSYVLGISERLPAVQASEFYLLNYSIKGVNNTGYDLLFRRDGSPYNLLADPPTYFLSNDRQEMQHLFEVTEGDDIPRLDFQFFENNQQTWLDNINLRRVEITPTNPDHHFRFLYNPNSTNQTFTLDETFMDIYGNTHSGSVELSPYSSLILMTETAAVALPIELFDFRGQLVEQEVELDWEIGEATNFAYFEIQRSTDGQDFQTIGKTYPKREQSFFDFMDQQGTKTRANQLFYRLKMVDTDGKSDYSPVVVIYLEQETSVPHVYPNPTTGRIQIASADDAQLVEVFNLQGQCVKTARLNDSNLNLTELSDGIYFIKVLGSDNRVLSTERITLQR